MILNTALNTSINKLREALGEEAGTPRYIETLARRGYRFVAPVESVAPVSPPAVSVAATQPAEKRPWIAALILLTVLIGGAYLARWRFLAAGQAACRQGDAGGAAV